MKDTPMSTVSPSKLSTISDKAINTSSLATHPTTGRKVFSCNAAQWDAIFAFADANGFQHETMAFMLDEWLKTKQMH